MHFKKGTVSFKKKPTNPMRPKSSISTHAYIVAYSGVLQVMVFEFR